MIKMNYSKLTLFFVLLSTLALFSQETKKQLPFAKANFGKPARIPGAVQAEDFDEGGEGIGYHNVPPIQGDRTDRFRNLGLDYRDAEPEIEVAYGTNMLAVIRNGEWCKYTVEVLFDGVYELDLVSSGWELSSDAGAFRLYMDGVDMVGLFKPPFTGRWQDFSTKTFYGFKLTKGIHELKMVSYANDNINIDLYRFRLTPHIPYKETYHAIPGIVEAEYFDEGPEAVAYHTASSAATVKNDYRKTPVPISKVLGKTVASSKQAGEWWKYSIAVKEAGNYSLDVSLASLKKAAFKVEIYSFAVTDYKFEFRSDLIQIPSNEGKLDFKTLNIPNINLTEGKKIVKVIMEDGSDLLYVDNYNLILKN